MLDNRDDKLINLINIKIDSFSLNEKWKSTIRKLLNEYGYDFVLECVEISYSKYIRFDEKGSSTVVANPLNPPINGGHGIL